MTIVNFGVSLVKNTNRNDLHEQKETKQMTEPFVQFPPLLFNEILIRPFFLVEIKILLLLIRLTEGCKGNDKKNSLISRQGCIMRQKKDFDMLGFPAQSINRTLKKLRNNNIIFEEKIQLTIRGILKTVCCYSINPDLSTWNVPSLSSQKALDQLISLNLTLKPFQLAKISNIRRYKKVLMHLQSKSPLNLFLEILNIASNPEYKSKLSDLFVYSLNSKGDSNILIGFKNVIDKDRFDNFINRFSNNRCLLGILTIDIKLLLGILTINNNEVEGEILEVIKNPEPALYEIYEGWLKAIVKTDENDLLKNDFLTDLNDVLDKFEVREPIDDSITIINKDGITSIHCYFDDDNDTSSYDSTQEDYDNEYS